MRNGETLIIGGLISCDTTMVDACPCWKVLKDFVYIYVEKVSVA